MVTVDLIGTDGNAFSIIGKVITAMRRGGIDAETINEFKTEAMSGDYDHLLRTVMDYVEVA